MSLDPDAAVAANNLAWIYAEEGEQLDRALEMAQTAKARLPEQAEVDDTLGWVYYQKGLFSLAMNSFRLAVERNSRNALYHYHLGLTQRKMGQDAQARASFQTCLKLDPAFEQKTLVQQQLASLAP
jgi:Tfp pilus assembly protein PilF